MSNPEQFPDDIPVSRMAYYTVNVKGDILFSNHTGLIAGENNIPKALLAGRAFDISLVPLELRNKFNEIKMIGLMAVKGLGPDRNAPYVSLPVWLNEFKGMKTLWLMHHVISINDELKELEYLQLEDVVFEDHEIVIDAILRMDSLKKNKA